MFGSKKTSRQTEPSAIATAVLNVCLDPNLSEQCQSAFSRSKEQKDRMTLSVIIFTYCCSYYWATMKKDSSILLACSKAAEIIPRCFSDADRLVQLGGYVVSRYELVPLHSILEQEFHQKINIDAGDAFKNFDLEKIDAAIQLGVSKHVLKFSTLIGALLILRRDRFMGDIRASAQEHIDTTFLVLASSFDEQVSGSTLSDLRHGPRLAADEEIREFNGSVSLRTYYNRSIAALDSLAKEL